MADKTSRKSPFEGAQISIVIGDGRWEWGGGKGMTRAVIELARDINDLMPKLKRVLNGCAFDPVNHSVGFRVEDYSVVIDNRRMLITGAASETQVNNVLEWLTKVINGDLAPAKGEDNYLYHNKLG